MMDRRDVQAFLKGVSTVVREQLSSMGQTLSKLEARLDAVASVQPLKGDPGESIRGDVGPSAFEVARSAGFPGTVEEWLESLRGKDAPPVDVESIVIRAAELVPQPKSSETVDIEAIAARVAALIGIPQPVDEERIILQVLERSPKPENGKSVDPSEVLQMVVSEVTRAVQAIPPAANGKDADMDTLAVWVSEAVARSADTVRSELSQRMVDQITAEVAKIPPPKDGKSPDPIHPDTVALMVREYVDKLPKPEPGKPGDPGKSALEIEVRTGIDPAKSYPFGTVATYQGGTIRARRDTDPITDGLDNAGWSVLLDGIAEETLTQSEDFRSLEFTRTYTSGRSVSWKVNTPFMQWRGYWKPGEYLRSDCVTQNGSTWYCIVDQTSEKPGEGSKDWIMIARKGSDGRDLRPDTNGTKRQVRFE